MRKHRQINQLEIIIFEFKRGIHCGLELHFDDFRCWLPVFEGIFWQLVGLSQSELVFKLTLSYTGTLKVIGFSILEPYIFRIWEFGAGKNSATKPFFTKLESLNELKL